MDRDEFCLPIRKYRGTDPNVNSDVKARKIEQRVSYAVEKTSHATMKKKSRAIIDADSFTRPDRITSALESVVTQVAPKISSFSLHRDESATSSIDNGNQAILKSPAIPETSILPVLCASTSVDYDHGHEEIFHGNDDRANSAYTKVMTTELDPVNVELMEIKPARSSIASNLLSREKTSAINRVHKSKLRAILKSVEEKAAIIDGFSSCPVQAISENDENKVIRFLYKGRVYGYPNTNGSLISNYLQYIRNNHPVLSICLAHKLHPFTKKSRVIVFFCVSILAYALSVALLQNYYFSEVNFSVSFSLKEIAAYYV